MALKKRERILAVFAFIAAAIWGFDHFYYSPQSRKMMKLKEEIKTADQQRSHSLSLIQGVEKLEADVSLLEKQINGLNKRTLRGEEFRAFLKHLAQESDPLQMKVVSLNPTEEKLLLPGGKEQAVQGRKKILVRMVLHSTYGKFRKYLKDVQDLPFLVYIDSLQVEKKEEIHPLLKVSIELSLHTLSL